MASIKIYHSIDTSPNQRLVLYTQPYKDRTYIHLRLWYQPAGEEEFQPGKGVILPRSSIDLHELADGLHELAEVFAQEGSFSPKPADDSDEEETKE